VSARAILYELLFRMIFVAYFTELLVTLLHLIFFYNVFFFNLVLLAGNEHFLKMIF
jgi:hypothetical protein